MAGRRRIIRTNFSFEKMNELDLVEARRYFITNFFVPVAYCKWEDTDLDAAVLHVCRKESGSYFFHISSYRAPTDERMTANNIAIQHIGIENDYDVVHKALGIELKPEEVSKALSRAFEPCFPTEGNVDTLHRSPLVAYLRRDLSDDNVRLKVLVKLRDKVNNQATLIDQGVTMQHFLVLHAKYGRHYHVISGKWHGLCVDDPCKRCGDILSSKFKDNAYTDE